MIHVVRALAVATVLAAALPGTALACIGELVCTKTADVSEVTTYPATVKYTVELAYTLPGDRCAVATLTDSLLPPGSFTFPGSPTSPDLFWVSNPPTGTEKLSYELQIDSFEACAALGSPPAADGSVTLTNFVDGASYFEDTFACQKEVVCRPPSEGSGCTATPGYWKTHSAYGPAPFDATWTELAASQDSAFFGSGRTWFEVFWTDSRGGAAYYILARAYMAAVLNGFAGASSPEEVATAVDLAAGFFASHSPTSALTKAERAQALAWAGLLDNYNNGLIGPGHCE